jgi:hypothetical protein
MAKEKLDEVFALPIGLKPVMKLDGKVIYGSDSLNSSFLRAIAKSKRTSPYLEKYRGMIKKRELIICFKGKGFKSFLKWKVFRPSNMPNYVGFFDPPSKKIFLFISSSANIFAYVSNNFMSKLLVHESMHMFADKKRSSFLSLFKGDLTSYYKNLWIKYFKLDETKVKDSSVQSIYSFLFKNIELKTVTRKNLEQYYQLLYDEFSPITTLDKDPFKKFLMDYIVFARIFALNQPQFMASIGPLKHVYFACYQAYKDAFSLSNTTTVCVQELIFPSEIIAIMSEDIGSSRIKTAIKSL